MEKQQSKAKKYLKIAGKVVGAFFILFVGMIWGTWSNEVTLEDKVYKIDEVDKELNASTKEYETLKKDVDSMKDEKEESEKLIADKEKNEKELKEVTANLKDTKGALDKELESGRKSIDKELEDYKATSDKEIEELKESNEKEIAKINKEKDGLESKLKEAKAEVKSVENKVKAKEKELSSLTGQVKKAEGQPKTLNAGDYTVGKDVPEARYEATPQGEGSNFVVRDAYGKLKVNTILGSYGENSYTFYAEEGDSIRTEASVKLTPVE